MAYKQFLSILVGAVAISQVEAIRFINNENMEGVVDIAKSEGEDYKETLNSLKDSERMLHMKLGKNLQDQPKLMALGLKNAFYENEEDSASEVSMES